MSLLLNSELIEYESAVADYQAGFSFEPLSRLSGLDPRQLLPGYLYLVCEDLSVAASAFQSLDQFDNDLFDASRGVPVVQLDLSLYGLICEVVISLELHLESAVSTWGPQAAEFRAHIHCDTLHKVCSRVKWLVSHIEPP